MSRQFLNRRRLTVRFFACWWQRFGLALSLWAITLGVPAMASAIRSIDVLAGESTDAGDGDTESPAEESEDGCDGETVGIVSLRSLRACEFAGPGNGAVNDRRNDGRGPGVAVARHDSRRCVGSAAHLPLRC